MNKNTKLLLGVAAAGAVGYYLWSKYKTPTASNFASLVGCPCRQVAKDQPAELKGTGYVQCAGGQACKGGGKAQM